MKKIVLIIFLLIVLTILAVTLTACTLQLETTDNSVSASIDGDTTEKVDNILDWIKERLSRVFDTSDTKTEVKTDSSVKTNI